MLKMLTVEKLHAESLVAAGGAMNATACLNAIMWMNQKSQKSTEGACLMIMLPEQTNYPLLSTSFVNKVNTVSNKAWGNMNVAPPRLYTVCSLCDILGLYIDCVMHSVYSVYVACIMYYVYIKTAMNSVCM